MDDGRWTLEPGSRRPGLDACHAVLQGGHPVLHLLDPLLQLGIGEADHRPQLSFHALHADEDPRLALSEGVVPLHTGVGSLREDLHRTSEILRHDIDMASRLRVLSPHRLLRGHLVQTAVHPFESLICRIEFPAEKLHQLLGLTVGHGTSSDRSPEWGTGVPTVTCAAFSAESFQCGMRNDTSRGREEAGTPLDFDLRIAHLRIEHSSIRSAE